MDADGTKRTMEPALGSPDPDNAARSYKLLACELRGCPWRWRGYLPTDTSAASVAIKPIVDDHYRAEHPDVPRGE